MELKLLLCPVRESEDPLFLKEDSLMLLDVLPDVDISALHDGCFLLDEPPNLDLPRSEFENDLVDGRGGGIRARAEICLYKNSQKKKST